MLACTIHVCVFFLCHVKPDGETSARECPRQIYALWAEIASGREPVEWGALLDYAEAREHQAREMEEAKLIAIEMLYGCGPPSAERAKNKRAAEFHNEVGSRAFCIKYCD